MQGKKFSESFVQGSSNCPRRTEAGTAYQFHLIQGPKRQLHAVLPSYATQLSAQGKVGSINQLKRYSCPGLPIHKRTEDITGILLRHLPYKDKGKWVLKQKEVDDGNKRGSNT